LINVNEAGFSNFRDLSRIPEKKLVDTIFYNINEKMKSILKSLFNKRILDQFDIKYGRFYGYDGRDSTVISKSKLNFNSFARHFSMGGGFNTSLAKKFSFLMAFLSLWQQI
jgi:hypothetical protein